ncbi:OLC1v1021543C1 [Oldenlandia corymbosa var. corymbosa]|uniref:OLC1v1021543C1 n=1 Tax=Oldenlandia corymbosa var. corymbosa TaxID=529605 RepID=A0AAV1BX75_OLDCO|nr:OLC1v1021543C1 [Oldenlandia corymbosa var. corymbosa]
MDFPKFSLEVKDVLKGISLLRSKNGKEYEFDLVIFYARIWFLKAEIFVHSRSTSLTTSVEDFIVSLYEGSIFLLKSFSSSLQQDSTEKQFLKLIEAIPGRVESLLASSQCDDFMIGNGTGARDLLYKFLVQAKLFKAEMLILELLNESIEDSLKQQIGILREGLILLIKSEINLQEEEDTENKILLLADIEGLAAEIISLCGSCQADNIESQLSLLLGKVQVLKTKLKDLYFQVPKLSVPKTLGLAYIKLLLGVLKQLPSRSREAVACANYQFEAIHGDLELISCNYGHIFNKDNINNQKTFDDIRTRLVNAAQHVEYVMESMASSNDINSHYLLWLFHLSEEITDIKKQLVEYCENSTTIDVEVETHLYRYQHLVPPPPTETMVGFNKEKDAIINRLTTGTTQLEVVSITGMPGIGKTTLAQNVFNSPIIEGHFHTRKWCRVSLPFRKSHLFLDLLLSFSEVKDDIREMSDDDICLQLHLYLRSRRYLIVLDDVRSSAAWDDLKSSFPDGSFGSRILMTSCIYNVVQNPHLLQGLSSDESWELLQMLIFGNEGCPPELAEVGQQIAGKCRGLPHAIVSVAKLLIKKPKAQWEKVAESASLQIVNAKRREYMKIFERSYEHLPDHLKQCFLYFGMCPKDENVSVQRLLWQWIAEGFIPEMKPKSLEDLAEEYLMDLIQRSLVILAKQRSDGEEKTCRVHDQILDFCLLKAKEEKILQLMPTEPYYDSNFINSGHRVSICGDSEPFIASRPSGPYLRSLRFFDTSEMYAGCDSDVSFIFENFNSLKVLDLESINIGNSLQDGINIPIHLKYLGVGGDMDSLPPSLSKLQDLETLVVKGLMNKFVLPDNIWCLTKLRHVRVSNHCIFTLQSDRSGSDSKLDSLVSLSIPYFTWGEETNKTIERFPSLRKFKCVFLQPKVGSMNVGWLPDLGSLHQLDKLEVRYHGRPLKSGVFNLPGRPPQSGLFNLPQCLKKLTLSNFQLPWDQASAIGSLPNLEVLKLISKAFAGLRWDVRAEEFVKLKYLKLESLDIVHWDVSLVDDPLPRLEQLVLRNCKQLQEVPSSFAEIFTLQRIEVHQCGVSVEESVSQIAEKQMNFGNEVLISVFS